MLNSDDYDVVLGTGLVGVSATNLLSQSGRKVYNIGISDMLPIQKNNSSLNLQGWLISGTTWFFDPVSNVPSLYYRQFNNIREIFHNSQYETNYNKSIAILTKNQFSHLKKRQGSVPIFQEETDKSKIEFLLNRNYNKEYYYLNILDVPYDTSYLLNAINAYSMSIGAELLLVNEKNIEIKPIKESTKFLIKAGEKELLPSNLYLCAGESSFRIIRDIFNNPHPTLLNDPKLNSFGLKEQFRAISLRSPLISLHSNDEIAADVIIDLTRHLSIVKHKKSIVLATSKYSREYDSTKFWNNNHLDNENMIKFTKECNEYYPSLILSDSWFCNRLERKVSHMNSNYYSHTISNWVGLSEFSDRLIYGISGKGTMALNTAKQMVSLKNKTTNINYKLKHDFKTELFKNRFNGS